MIRDAKPILLIKLEEQLWQENLRTNFTLTKLFEEKFNDYHVLVVPAMMHPKQFQEPVALQVFHAKDISDIEVQGLKDLIKHHLTFFQNNKDA